MIKKTRIKIVLVTMGILVAVFVSVGAVAYGIMTNRPQRYPFDEQMQIERPKDPDFDNAIKEVEKQLAREWLLWYLLVAGGGLTVLLIITYFLSGWIVKPIKQTMQKQKQFISDASHELKTPISIISANADLLSASEAENKWLDNIKAQARRMQLLTNDLLVLAKLDEASGLGAERLSLSEAVRSAVLSFESLVFETGKTLSTNIAEGISYQGIKEEVVRATSILLDNAVKYSDSGASIRVSLARQGDRPALEVHNSGSGISEQEQQKIFDRFYRSDYSRNRMSGGNGLGLAIIKSLADKNNWRISVKSDGNSYVMFTILF